MMDEPAVVRQERRFFTVFLLSFVMLGALIFVFKRTDLFPWVGGCNSAGYDDDHYMAYCHSTRYGDYEHFALYNGLEPEAITALKQAQVLFVGNSNTQYAFSTDNIQRYFELKQVTHYVMGFGQGAKSPVARAVIEKHALTPRMVVANIDPFFSTEVNGTFQRVLNGDERLVDEFTKKKKLQGWQAEVCSKPDSRWQSWLCQGSADTLFRSVSNGHWRTDYYRDNLNIAASDAENKWMDKVEQAAVIAEEFMAAAGIDRSCLVLTVTPRTETPTGFAKALASRLQTPAVFPELQNMHTIDHSHLTPDSANRWSAEFVKQFDQYVQACIDADHTKTIEHAEFE